MEAFLLATSKVNVKRMYMKEIKNPLCFYSNTLMLFPAFLAYQAKLYHVCGLTIGAMACSMYYHMDEENHHGLLVDMAGVVVMIACFAYMFLTSDFLFTYMNAIGVVYINLALWYYARANDFLAIEEDEGRALSEDDWKQYEFYHVGWHLLVSLSCAAFVYSYHGTRTGKATRMTTNLAPTCVEKSQEQKEEDEKSVARTTRLYCSAMNIAGKLGERIDALDPPSFSRLVTWLRRKTGGGGGGGTKGRKEKEKGNCTSTDAGRLCDLLFLCSTKKRASDRTTLRILGRSWNGSRNLPDKWTMRASSTANMARHVSKSIPPNNLTYAPHSDKMSCSSA